MWKGFKEFLTYNRKQRNGLLALLAVALLLQLALYFNDYFFLDRPEDLSEFRRYVKEWEHEDSLARFAATPQFKLFYFDPNTASDSVLQVLGFSPKLASTIINYRSKGGQFRRAKDLEKIYGMDSSLYKRVLPFISIASAERNTASGKATFKFTNFDLNTVSETELQQMGLYDWQAQRIINFRDKVRPYKKPEELYKVYDLDSFIVEKMLPFATVDTANVELKKKDPEEELAMVEINSADSLELLELSGVGPFYAKMIKKYRGMLGGFYRKEQLLEVYNLDQERLDQFSDQLLLDTSAVRKLDINTAGFKELLRHPYLSYEVVKNIVNFREEVRPYQSIEELKHIELIDAQLFSKIAPYLRTTREIPH